MKNIVIIGPAHPLRGGLATFDERLARAFQDEGHRVTLVTFSLQYPDFLFPGKTQYSTDPAPDDIDIQVLINSVNPFNWLSVGLKLKKNETRPRDMPLLVTDYGTEFGNDFTVDKTQSTHKNYWID